MMRVKVIIPNEKPLFTTTIPIRITDINYGNHLGNDRMLAIVQEARVQWLQSIGYSETDIGGCGLIMADALISYKNEGHYGEDLRVSLFMEDITKVAFDLLFKVSIGLLENEKIIAEGKTGMVAFDYKHKRVVSIPSTFKRKLG